MADRPTDNEDFCVVEHRERRCEGLLVHVTSWFPIRSDEHRAEDAARLRSLAEKLQATAEWVEDDE